MAKILLVEDDNNLREIYEARLMAEGYEIVSGEEALTVAMKEKPDLIISDVMMPKISGFDMLDILRTTEETKNAKVIMMTALSQAEDKARAEKLGADRYLVKSQVTLEDVAKVAKQVLEGDPAGGTTGELPTPQPVVTVAQPATSQPPAPAPEPVIPMPIPEPVAPPAPTPDPTPSSIPPVAPTPVALPVDPVTPPPPVPEPVKVAPAVTVATSDDVDTADDDENEEHKKKVIQPLNDLHEDPQAKLDALLEKEKAREEMAQTVHEVVQASQPAVVADPAADVATPDMPVAPPPAAASNNPDPNSIAL